MPSSLAVVATSANHGSLGGIRPMRHDQRHIPPGRYQCSQTPIAHIVIAEHDRPRCHSDSRSITAATTKRGRCRTCM